MKMGTRVEGSVTGDVVYVSDMVTHVKDENTGALWAIHANGGERGLRQIAPKNWPPQEGDTWKHLGVSFLVEGRGDKVWMIGEDGSESPEEVLRMRPGIKLSFRPEKNIYSEKGFSGIAED